MKPGEPCEIFINGQLAAECLGGTAVTRDKLLDQLRELRTLRTMRNAIGWTLDRLRTIVNIEDHINTKPVAKQQQFVRGLFDGLQGKTVPHPMGAGIPPMQPDHTHSYTAGYEYGDCLRRCLEITKEPVEE